MSTVGLDDLRLSKLCLQLSTASKKGQIKSNDKTILYSLFLFMILPSLASSVIADSNSHTSSHDKNSPGSSDSSIDNLCDACNLVVKSFEKGLEKTSRGKYEGGDTSWEEKNLRNYADSEVRLIEIQEDLCNDVEALKNKTVCLSMAENAESHIEDWWFKQRKDNVRLHDFLCISRLKHCCPEGYYGQNCQKCAECNNHGSCDGSGTRQGTGACICDQGYTGRECDECTSGYFKIAISDLASACLRCDSSCLLCQGPGAGNCTECQSGYRRDQSTGNCVDINECDLVFDNNVEASRVCKGNTYCLNTDGHFKCINCHKSCSGCFGPEPSECISCAPGYQMDRRQVCTSVDDIDALTRILGDNWLTSSPSKLFHYVTHNLLARMLTLVSVNGIISWWTGASFRMTLFISIVVNLSLALLLDFHFNLRDTLGIEVNSE